MESKGEFMASVGLVSGQIVRIDMSHNSRSERDLVWLELIGQYGNRNVKVTNAGLAYEVEFPPDPRLAELQMLVGTLVPGKRRCGT